MSHETIDGINREIRTTAKQRFEEIRSKRADVTIKEPKPQRGTFEKPRRRKYNTFWVDRNIRGYSSAAALGDAIRKQILSRARGLAMHDPEKEVVVLVKDGKLTPEGIARGIKL